METEFKTAMSESDSCSFRAYKIPFVGQKQPILAIFPLKAGCCDSGEKNLANYCFSL